MMFDTGIVIFLMILASGLTMEALRRHKERQDDKHKISDDDIERIKTILRDIEKYKKDQR